MPRTTLDLNAVDRLIEMALAEDVGPGDVTTAALIDPKLRGRAELVAREPGVLAGMPVVRRLLRAFDAKLRLSSALKDGASLERNTRIGVVSGPVASILTVERTLLNFLQYLSGIATTTRQYVDAIADTGVKLLDTRKTLPGWRSLSKYAVTVGGGMNHRFGLYDQILIKDNHLYVNGNGGAPGSAPMRVVKITPTEAAAIIRGGLGPKRERKLRIEVEVETVQEAEDAALMAGPDIIMLDNMPPARMRKAVAAIRRVRADTIIEASGGITLRNIAAVARTGVDWISVGAVTHSARSLDIALEMETD